MSSITFDGGVRELGGNQILLEDKGTKIYFDFGINFKRYSKYFLFPYSPKKFNALCVYIEKEIYPNRPGIYRNDYLKQIGRKEEEKSIDAIVLSHAHLDHTAGIHFLRPDITIYTDVSTRKILYALQKTSGTPFNEFIELTYYNELVPKVNGEGFRFLRRGEGTIRRPVNLFEPKKPFKIGDVEIEAYPVDHSMPGAHGFIIHSSKGVIVYTGDLRFRGRRREDTEAFIEAARQAKPKYLLCEGSLIDKKQVGSEDDIVKQVSDEIDKHSGMIIVSYPPRDLDRVETLCRIARRTKRQLVIDTRQAFLLDLFNGEYGYPKTSSNLLRIFMPRKGAGLIDTEYEDLWETDYFSWERKYIEHKNRVTLDELKKNPGAFIVSLSFSSLDDLIELEPPKDSYYLRLHPEPYTEELELQENVTINWLKAHNLFHEEQLPLFGEDSYNIPQAHVTGHMSQEETTYLINRINPDVLIPIHTLYPEWFRDMFKGDVLIFERGEKLEL